MALSLRSGYERVVPLGKKECELRCDERHGTLLHRINLVRWYTRIQKGALWNHQIDKDHERCEKACLSGKKTNAVAWAQNKSNVAPYTHKELTKMRNKNNISSTINKQVITAEGKLAPATSPQPFPVGVHIQMVINALVTLPLSVVQDLAPADLLQAWCSQPDDYFEPACCPITNRLFRDLVEPTVASDGCIYEFDDLVYWLGFYIHSPKGRTGHLSDQLFVGDAIRAILEYMPKRDAVECSNDMKLWLTIPGMPRNSSAHSRPPARKAIVIKDHIFTESQLPCEDECAIIRRSTDERISIVNRTIQLLDGMHWRHDNFLDYEKCVTMCINGQNVTPWVSRTRTPDMQKPIVMRADIDMNNCHERVVSEHGTIVVRTDPQPYPFGVRLERVIEAVRGLPESLVRGLVPELLKDWCDQKDDIPPENKCDGCVFTTAPFAELETPVVASDGNIYELASLITFVSSNLHEPDPVFSPWDRLPLSGQVTVLAAIRAVLRRVPKYYALQKEPALAHWCSTCSKTGSCGQPLEQPHHNNASEPERTHPVITHPRYEQNMWLESARTRPSKISTEGRIMIAGIIG